MNHLDLLLAGSGERARAWAEVARASPRLAVRATVARGESLSAALAAHPDAATLVALPPLAATEAALELARSARRALVQAPLSPSLSNAPLPPGAADVLVAHGWTNLPGRRLCERFIAEREITRLYVETRGLPESAEGDLDEALWHALALARRLVPEARIHGVQRLDDARIELDLRGTRTSLELRVRASGEASVAVRLEDPRGGASYRFEDGRESWTAGASTRQREVPPGAVRALLQLASPESGDTLVDAALVARLMRDTAAWGGAFPPGARRLRQSARIAAARPDDLLGRLGLGGAVPDAPSARRLPDPPEAISCEQWAFRAGLKPVAFLTVRPEDVDAALAPYEGAHVERIERRVLVGAQDAWVDRRDVGEPRVELYVSRDPSLAARAARVQSAGDPSGQVRQLGELMGYPGCCVEAFARQTDRANNTANRYLSAARTPESGPWPWELNNLFRVTVPFYPCRYTCPDALAWARAAFAEMARHAPESLASLRRVLARPVLYFDHDTQIVFEGASDGRTVRYSDVQVPGHVPESVAKFAGALGLGDALLLGDDALVVLLAGREILRLRRTDPALGLIAPFAEDPAS